jgi:hypothetical protein
MNFEDQERLSQEHLQEHCAELVELTTDDTTCLICYPFDNATFTLEF